MDGEKVVLTYGGSLAIASGMGLLRFKKDAKRFYLSEEKRLASEIEQFLNKDVLNAKIDDSVLELHKEIEELEEQIRRLS
jgi:hypothetical protein